MPRHRHRRPTNARRRGRRVNRSVGSRLPYGFLHLERERVRRLGGVFDATEIALRVSISNSNETGCCNNMHTSCRIQMRSRRTHCTGCEILLLIAGVPLSRLVASHPSDLYYGNSADLGADLSGCDDPSKNGQKYGCRQFVGRITLRLAEIGPGPTFCIHHIAPACFCHHHPSGYQTICNSIWAVILHDLYAHIPRKVQGNLPPSLEETPLSQPRRMGRG